MPATNPSSSSHQGDAAPSTTVQPPSTSTVSPPHQAAYRVAARAHAVVLSEHGHLEAEVARAIVSALRVSNSDTAPDDVHFAEAWLAAVLGTEHARRVVFGLHPGDLDAIAWRWRTRSRLLALVARANALRAALLDLAGQHLLTVLPTYTHGKQAQITTLAHTFASWTAALETNVQQIWDVVELNQGGSRARDAAPETPATARRRLANLLAFDDLPFELDDLYGPDLLLHQLGVITTLLATVARFADDIAFWATDEIAMVEVTETFWVSDPVFPEQRRALVLDQPKLAAARALGCLTEMTYAFKERSGVPALGVRVPAQFDELLVETVDTLGAFREVLLSLRINADRMRELAGMHWAQATDVAAALVTERGLSWRTAHQIVGILVRHAYERGFGPGDLTPALLDEAAVEYQGTPVALSEEALRRALDPVEFVRARTLLGGTAPEEVTRQCQLFGERLARDEARLADLQGRLDAAAAALDAAEARILAGR